MLNPPGGQELLKIARREELKLAEPGFTGNRRYLTLLINRAREIAERDAAYSADSDRRVLALLNTLYAITSGVGYPEDIQHCLYTLNVRLAADLRARRLDSAQHAKVLEVLSAQVRARLAITNPKYLDTVNCDE